ncbi:MAG TPA: penicillin-binding transpeptidase domain-containing protein [Candidatus Levybacteria bacterium]|nr:penicillin-binding transpeptidase domain-containing protein [Candidatus Levybacteria bacterium]
MRTRKTKIGPAFSESVSTGNLRIRRDSKGIFTPEVLALIPLICLVLVAGFFVVRLFYLQVLRSDYYRRLSDENRMRTTIIPAPRGIIFDRNGEALVSNSPAFSLRDESDSDKKVTFIPRDEALTRIANGEEIVSDIQREYLFKGAFAHVLGYIGQISQDELAQSNFQDYARTDFVGKMGLEQYENILHGRNGRELYEVDAKGEKVRFLGKDVPISGRNIHTTLDAKLQEAVAEAMKEASKGAVIVSDPRDGGVMALYSKPSFDPNLFTHPSTYTATGDYQKVEDILLDGNMQPLLNRAIGGAYPPGSTYKLVSGIAALETGAMKRDSIVKDTGILRVGAFSFGNWYWLQYGRTDGDVDIVKAVERSNDIYFYKAAEATGIKRLSEWSRKFGLGTKTTIDLGGEVSGTVPDEAWKKKVIGESWYLGDNYNMGIGQGYLLATPLQVNMFTLPFANGGTLYQPHLIKGQKKELQSNFVKKENLDAIREGMRRSCAPGGGVAFPFFDFKVHNEKLQLDGRDFVEVNATGSGMMTQVAIGCKTGTSESGGERKPHAWITVMAPFYNPEIVVTVLVETAGEGSSVAGPIAEKIVRSYFEGKN